MTVGAIGFQPYVYNTNSVSRASLNSIKGISEDVLNSKVDYTGLSTSNDTTNPLKMGSSSNFMEILSSQMELGKSNASRIMQDSGSEAEATATPFKINQALEAYQNS